MSTPAAVRADAPAKSPSSASARCLTAGLPTVTYSQVARLFGGAADDTFFFLKDAQVSGKLDGGGNAALTGGSGADWFFKGPTDVITDLSSGEQVN